MQVEEQGVSRVLLFGACANCHHGGYNCSFRHKGQYGAVRCQFVADCAGYF